MCGGHFSSQNITAWLINKLSDTAPIPAYMCLEISNGIHLANGIWELENMIRP